MAEKEKKAECYGDLRSIHVRCAENGYEICCNYNSEQTLSQKAGWVPCCPSESKDYVEKTPEAAAKQFLEILKHKNCPCSK
jgi:hypothetical protein